MSTATRTDITMAYSTASDALLTISRIHLGSIERLSVLNLNTMRQAMDDLAAAAKSLPQANGVFDVQTLPAVLAQPLWERLMAYSRSTGEIVAEAQQEIATAMAERFSQPDMASAIQNSWSAAFDLFSRGIRPITAAATELPAAATREGARAAAEIATYVKKAA